jgi:hypothetical protein
MRCLTLSALLCFGTWQVHAVPATANLILVDESGFNAIDIAIDVPVVGGSSDTSEVSGTVAVELEIDPLTDEVTELTVVDGNVSGSGVEFSRNIIVARYDVTASSIGAVLSTPDPPGVVDGPTGDFDAAQHWFTINSGELEGEVRAGFETTVIPPVNFADAPVTGPGTGTGNVSLVETGSTATSKTYAVTVTLPVSLDGEFEASPGQVVGVDAGGTVKATGSVTVPVNPYEFWAAANGMAGARFDADENGDGIANGLQWALGLAENEPARPHLLRPAPGGFEIVLPAGGSAGVLRVMGSDHPGMQAFTELDASAVSVGNPIPPGTTGTVVVNPGAGVRGFLRLEATEVP